MLRRGDRVRVSWSHKTGRVLMPQVPTRGGDGEPPGVLVLLDPFWPRWAGEAVARLDCPAHLTGLEVIYDLRDLEPL
jgi:hypothetical protein